MRPSGTARGGVPALRAAALALVVAGCALLPAATAATVVSVRIGGAADPVLATGTAGSSGWDRHGPALVLLGLAALPLGLLALRGSRAAAAAVAVLGLTALLVALLDDLPAIRDADAVRQVYADSDAGPGTGWYAETAGAIALMLAGGLLLLLPPPRRAERDARRATPARSRT